MVTNVAKWGNSLAVRIPQNIAQAIQISEGSQVTFSVENGTIVIKPSNRKRYSLEELVSQITPENCHTETDTGLAVGNEVW
ncbi:Antitoxin MazE [Planktothrix tepida]|uniref:Transcriptional regulator/antitoxin, MazE n=2 Tax=Planktothrix TaxID=54304 RepID=A0A1J1LPA2_9CYAN|nr:MULTISPECIES: AbrB/MazE/SpoVT family DNA-binding domain-containing protein [Planktothrix]CAD5953579.1 Antitoxin MazE [Planktothrix pseudagardhii]CAD5956990.1 Antitoxin MazE [Planktothrix tepida]CUR34070.1 Transcriptional regulator/antitoxin, MazE [Planktothrix tepida PCC 9214]